MKEAPEDEERAGSYSTALLPQSGSDNQGLGCGERVLGKPSILTPARSEAQTEKWPVII